MPWEYKNVGGKKVVCKYLKSVSAYCIYMALMYVYVSDLPRYKL